MNEFNQLFIFESLFSLKTGFKEQLEVKGDMNLFEI